MGEHTKLVIVMYETESQEVKSEVEDLVEKLKGVNEDENDLLVKLARWKGQDWCALCFCARNF